VSDQGQGIKRQNMPHIFEPFFTSNEEAQGAGLGLAIARELADRMHGRLSVRSVPGRTTFSLDLPA
jgi:signal transduction histidine kinase